MKAIAILVGIVLLSARGFAQHDLEATDCTMMFENLPCNLVRYPNINIAPLPIVQIPLTMHVVRYDDGSGGFTGDLSVIVNTLNQKFAGAKMQFFAFAILSHNSTYFASQVPPYDATKEDALSAQYNIQGTINMYIVPEYSGGSGTFTPDIMGQLGRSEQSIILSNENASTTSPYHEMGHYFNLLHTFERACGTDTPVTGSCPTGTDPVNAGDVVPDTHPDPWPGEYWSGCNFTGPTNWCPSPYNLMSYAFSCRTSLTSYQLGRVRTTLNQKRPELIGMYGRFTNLIGQSNPGGSLLVDGSVTIPSGGVHRFTSAGSHNVRTNNERFVDFGGSSDYKHHDWNQQVSDFRLTHSFTLTGDPILYVRDARFEEMSPVTATTSLVDAPSLSGGTLQFNDPWFLNSDGTQGNNFGPQVNVPLNQNNGMTGAYNQTTGGVFLNQVPDPQDTNKPYYSVGAPNPNTIDGITSYFTQWTGDPSHVAYQNANASHTGVVFKLSNATLAIACSHGAG